MWVDVGKLIRQRTPDKNGSVLPPDLTMGAYEIDDLTDRGVGNLFEGKVIVDKTYGHAAYGCAQCCGYSQDAYMYWDPLGVVLDATNTQDIWDMDYCTSQYVSIVDFFPDPGWGTGDHSIATADGRVIKGVGVGKTTNFATGTVSVGGPSSYKCPPTPLTPTGTINVCPTSTSIGGRPPGCSLSAWSSGLS